MSIVKALGIPAAPQGAQRLKPMDSAAMQARVTVLKGETARPPAPARILPAASQAANFVPQAGPAASEISAAKDAKPSDEAARLFTRQTLSAYAALLAGEETVAGYGPRSGPASRPAQDGPPKPPGSVIDFSA